MSEPPMIAGRGKVVEMLVAKVLVRASIHARLQSGSGFILEVCFGKDRRVGDRKREKDGGVFCVFCLLESGKGKVR